MAPQAPDCGQSHCGPMYPDGQRAAAMKKTKRSALALLVIVSGCTERKPPFSNEQFVAAKAQCGAVGAYVIDAASSSIGFHNSSEELIEQANCLKKKLSGSDVHIVMVSSQLYERR